MDWDRYNLAKQAFITCNDDGEEGLTWDEISACEVKGNMIINNFINWNIHRWDTYIFQLFQQEQFCGLITVECPSEDDFKAFDINEDGILTWNEFMEVNLAMSGSARSAIEGLFRKEL